MFAYSILTTSYVCRCHQDANHAPTSDKTDKEKAREIYKIVEGATRAFLVGLGIIADANGGSEDKSG